MTNEGPDQTIPNKQMPVQSQNQRKDFLLSKYVSGIGKYHRPLNRTGVLPERRGERKSFPIFNQCVLLLLLYTCISLNKAKRKVQAEKIQLLLKIRHIFIMIIIFLEKGDCEVERQFVITQCRLPVVSTLPTSSGTPMDALPNKTYSWSSL